jgi:IclR family acetate operon transcriptional repressor
VLDTLRGGARSIQERFIVAKELEAAVKVSTPAVSSEAGSRRKSDSVQSIQRAHTILAALADAGTAPMSVLELAAATGLNRTIIYRLLKTMVPLGLVSEDQSRYSLGFETAILGLTYIDRLSLRRHALPYVIEMQSEVIDRPWGISLAAPIGPDIILLDRLWGPATPLTNILDIGSRLPLDRSALGLSILAFLPEDDGVARIGQERMKTLRASLQAIRDDRGLVIAENSVQPGLAAVAAPIRDGSGAAVGSLCVNGSISSGIGEDPFAKEIVQLTAERIGLSL